MARTDPEAVRGALGSDESEYPDGRLAFPIESAEAIVTNQLADYTTNTQALRMVETYVAAALAAGGPGGSGEIETVEADGARMRFATGNDSDGPASSLWETAREHDPTGRLGRKNTEFRVM